MWIIDIKDKRHDFESKQSLASWLPFLPGNFTNISAVYQRPSGEIVLFIGTDVYMFSLENLQLLDGYPKPITHLGVRVPYEVNEAVNTYTGCTFIFYNDDYYGEVDECSFTIKKYGYTKDYFPGLPRDGIDGVFRYKDWETLFLQERLHIRIR